MVIENANICDCSFGFFIGEKIHDNLEKCGIERRIVKIYSLI